MTPIRGVITLHGHGIRVCVERGHLVLENGIGTHLRSRFPRVRHGLRRLIVIGSDGTVSLAALRWLVDQKAAFVMLERDGSVLATTGPVHPSDARLRRAQALAHHSGSALQIVRELITQKLTGQESVARDRLRDSGAADAICRFRETLGRADTIGAIRLTESQAALAYWGAWRNVATNFPKNDLKKIPEHWRCFGTRASPLTGSPRHAVNPPNAILNYLYAVLESEARLAAAALGLDPGIGLLHVDSPARDSLACDLMEPIRPQVDAYLLDWISRTPLRREWFFEQRDGNCRLMGSFAERLSETSATWASAVAPVTESVAHMLSTTVHKQVRQDLPATHLTQSHRREARVNVSPFKLKAPPRPPHVCQGCGASIHHDKTFCMACGLVASTERMAQVARQGRLAAQSAEAQASRAQTQRLNTLARYAWKDSDQPGWLTEKVYTERIQPRLAAITVTILAKELRVSRPYATNIRAGRRRPHPRHWETIARLVGLFEH